MRICKSIIMFTLAGLISIMCLTGCSRTDQKRARQLTGGLFSSGKISSVEDINLRTDDGYDYYFTYGNEDFYALYSSDTWTIYNSYKITNPNDIKIICKALSEEHPVPGRDMESYRTPEDMTYEWEQHNLAYEQLPEDNGWRENAKNVDLDPEDQGKSFKEIYEERTGKQIGIEDIYEKKDKIFEKIRDHKDGVFEKVLYKLKEKIKEYIRS